MALGWVLTYESRWDDAELQYVSALRHNPNDADATMFYADFLVISGKPQDAVEAAAKAFRLNPRPPSWYYWLLGFAHGLAVATLRREETYRTASRRMLAVALALLGRISEVQVEAKLFLATSPRWRISSWLEIAACKNPKDAQVWIDGFRLAGLPE